MDEHLDEDWIDEDIWFHGDDDLEPAGSVPRADGEGNEHAEQPAYDEAASASAAQDSQHPNMDDSRATDDCQAEDVEERQCRICFGSDTPEEVEELGRLISPCLCSGTMSHVHVRCINEWRGKGRNKQTFYQCNQCRFRYRFNRTLFFGLATSRPLILLTSMMLFLFLTLSTGQILLTLLSSSTFDRWIRRPIQRVEDEMERQTQITFGSDTTTYSWGVGYGSMSGGLLDIVIRAVNVFASGEAEEVVAEGLRRVAEVTPVEAASRWGHAYGRIKSAIPIAPAVASFIPALLTRLSLGFSFIGSLSFVSLLISSSLLAPFQLANNLRFGRFGWGRLNRQRRAAEGGVGLGTVFLVVAVCAGAVRAIKQLYGVTNQLSQYLLLKAETAILEVNPKGEVLAVQPVLEDQAASERQRRLDAVVLDT